MFEHFWQSNTLNYAAFGIPAFFLFLGLEFVAARRRKNDTHFKFDSSVTNISIGIAERLLNLFLTAGFYNMFVYVFEHYRIFTIPNILWVWVLLLLATDFVWYWYHRLGHEINLFWAAHIVHHHSEEFNYTVSARITTFQAVIRNVFWCTLPLVGFHPSMVMTILIVHGTYSFFTHTELIGKLGWLEYILITPSHHRVHHSSNERYINKNYGDLFVFWDKMFGTFQTEDEKPQYGITHPLKSNSFIWQHFHYFLEMGYALVSTSGIRNKLKIIFGKPENLDQGIRPKLERYWQLNGDQKKLPASGQFRKYVTIQIITVVLILFVVTLFYPVLDSLVLFSSSLIILLTLVNCGAMLEQRQWVYHIEALRGVILIAIVSYYLSSVTFFLLAILLFILVAVDLKPKYLMLLYGQDQQ